MNLLFAIVALVTAAAAGTWLAGCGESDDGPLADLVGDDVTILRAERVEGYDGRHPQLIVNWGRIDRAQDDRILEEGLSVYDEHRAGRRYRRTFVLDPPDNPTKQLHHGIGHSTSDLDGDGREEILAVEELGGSAGNRTYHLIGRSGTRTRDLYRKKLSYDDGLVRFGRESLITYEGVVRRPGDHGIHCCWSAYARTIRKLRGGRLVVVQRSRTDRLPTVDGLRDEG
jgi:hypothetical protein